MKVLATGAGIMAVATTVLVLVFRRFGKKSHPALVAALIAFIFVCCLALFLAARE
ncbi:MAG TPA: hypothetical protein VKB93_26855 [Thermoanaerobaculia bacterium]|nr:hypothetical protein [Thermoanaerobaculia bacterium]